MSWQSIRLDRCWVQWFLERPSIGLDIPPKTITVHQCSKQQKPRLLPSFCFIFLQKTSLPRDSTTETENGFMEAKYYAFRRWWRTPEGHHLTSGDWIPTSRFFRSHRTWRVTKKNDLQWPASDLRISSGGILCSIQEAMLSWNDNLLNTCCFALRFLGYSMEFPGFPSYVVGTILITQPIYKCRYINGIIYISGILPIGW